MTAERPSIGLSFFRLAVAFTVGAHILPTFVRLEDNYLSTAFKEKNPSFFTPLILGLVELSPDALVYGMAVVFGISLFLFAIGLFTQASSIVMVLACYYFYALNSLHIGTLSYDILLVTLSLMVVTGYPGDYFSIDSLRKGDPLAYKRARPFFIQGLLRMQVAFTYFYTALYKITGSGNWITGNPIFNLMRSSPESVVKHFPLRDLVGRSPELCYAIGVAIVVTELLMPALLYWKKTRVFAIGLGFLFHVMLVVTLHVPTIFFFLFPAQLLLFIEPEDIVAWIDRKRVANMAAPRDRLIYDGHCHFCLASLARLLVLDPTGKIQPVDYHAAENLKTLDPRLTPELCHSQIQLVTKKGELFGGFYAFRALAGILPLLWVIKPFLHLPGMGLVGSHVYDWIAKNRYLFHRKADCVHNACFR